MRHLGSDNDLSKRISNPPVKARQKQECATILAAFHREHLSESEATQRLIELFVPPPVADGDLEREAKRLLFAKGYENATDNINVLAASKLMVEFAALVSPSVTNARQGSDQPTNDQAS